MTDVDSSLRSLCCLALSPEGLSETGRDGRETLLSAVSVGKRGH